jgi:hypothetical protein
MTVPTLEALIRHTVAEYLSFLSGEVTGSPID